MSKEDLSEALINAGGGVRRRQPALPEPTAKDPVSSPPPRPASRAGTSPITVHFPMEVRDQLSRPLPISAGKPVYNVFA